MSLSQHLETRKVIIGSDDTPAPYRFKDVLQLTSISPRLLQTALNSIYLRQEP